MSPGIWPRAVYEWGTTEAERAREYPCDLLLPSPDDELHRGIDVEASSETLFRWLCQLRVAPYSYDWIDNFGRPSPQQLTPGLERLEPGQTFMRIFRLAAFEAGRSITLRAARGRGVEVVVTYLAEERGPGRSRLLVKVVARYSSRLLALPLRVALAPGDLIMMRKQLSELKRLAEGTYEEADRPAAATG